MIYYIIYGIILKTIIFTIKNSRLSLIKISNFRFSLSWPLGNFEMQKRIIQINEQVPTSLDLDLELEMWSLVKIYHLHGC